MEENTIDNIKYKDKVIVMSIEEYNIWTNSNIYYDVEEVFAGKHKNLKGYFVKIADRMILVPLNKLLKLERFGTSESENIYILEKGKNLY